METNWMWCSESTRSLGETFNLWPLTVMHSCAVNRDCARRPASRVVAFMILPGKRDSIVFFVFFILYVIFPFPRSLCKRKEKVSNTFRSLLSEFSRVLFLNSSGNRQSPPPFKSATQKYVNFRLSWVKRISALTAILGPHYSGISQNRVLVGSQLSGPPYGKIDLGVIKRTVAFSNNSNLPCLIKRAMLALALTSPMSDCRARKEKKRGKKSKYICRNPKSRVHLSFDKAWEQTDVQRYRSKQRDLIHEHPV